MPDWLNVFLRITSYLLIEGTETHVSINVMQRVLNLFSFNNELLLEIIQHAEILRLCI